MACSFVPFVSLSVNIFKKVKDGATGQLKF